GWQTRHVEGNSRGSRLAQRGLNTFFRVQQRRLIVLLVEGIVDGYREVGLIACLQNAGRIARSEDLGGEFVDELHDLEAGPTMVVEPAAFNASDTLGECADIGGENGSIGSQ